MHEHLHTWLLLRHLRHIARTVRIESLAALHASLSPEVKEGLATHAAVLSGYLEREGHPLGSPLLRALACLTPGAQRGRPGTLQRIWLDEAQQPSRHLLEAADWLMRSMAAVDEARQLSAAEVARLCEVLAVPLALEGDPVAALRDLERAAQAVTPGVPDKGAALLTGLDAPGARALSVELLGWMDSTSPSRRRIAQDALHALACLVPGSLDEVHGGLIERGILFPSELFHRASAHTAQALLELLKAGGAAHRPERVVEALAWVDSPEMYQTFAQWKSEAPAWAASLHVSPARLAHAAGWEPGPQGQRRALCAPVAWRLVPKGAEGSFDEAVVQVVVPQEAPCGRCHRSLILLFDLELSSPTLSGLGIPGSRLRVATCEACGAYGPVFTEIEPDGSFRWSEHNAAAEDPGVEGFDPLPGQRLVLGPRRRSVLEARASEPWQHACTSTLGGHPTWEQDSEYPPCPRCHRSMPFLGQVALDALGEPRDGTFYAFVCSDCGVAATVYQQT